MDLSMLPQVRYTNFDVGDYDFTITNFAGATLLPSTLQKTVFINPALNWDNTGATTYTIGQRVVDITDDNVYSSYNGAIYPAWSAGTYAINDLVNHNGFAYVSTAGSNTDEPGVGSPNLWVTAEPSIDIVHWTLVGTRTRLQYVDDTDNICICSVNA